jgi:hypothetical protein
VLILGSPFRGGFRLPWPGLGPGAPHAAHADDRVPQPGAPEVKRDGDHDDDANEELVILGVGAGQDQPGAHQPEEHRSDHTVDDPADPAEQGRADPHPDDFVEDALEAWRIIRGLDSPAIGLVYVASHTFHYGDRAAALLPQLGSRLGAAYIADTFDHRRSHGLRYITNPPGTPARVHQHLRIGSGDVNWEELFSTLRTTGYLDREDAIIVSNVFAEDETADQTSRYQLEKIRELIQAADR